MTEDDQEVLRAEAADIIDEALRHPFASMVDVGERERAELADWMRELVALGLIEGFERGFQTALERARIPRS